MNFLRLPIFAAMLCAFVAADDDIKYSDLDQTDLSIAVAYKDPNMISCPQEDIGDRAENCAELSWDDDDFITISWDLASAPADTTGVQVYRCFSKLFIKNRAWRKFKDIIRKDKQCKKIATIAKDDPQSYNYTIPSDTAEATYFFRVLVKCGPGKHDFCAKDDNALKFTDPSLAQYYAVDPMESIPTGLIVGVVIAIILAPTFLILYFVYEFGFQKRA
eukprot:TRINITY_DN2617_c0_g1_i1.p3 TRINITY_DN2617_c0_g1~~TRINITY_DN2617_c0_g1_i1.p3  ORF type:complete len:218 (+),score=49.51 TRINITY_DN2617_c0_g1_i1:114-767(+)